ncbi:MAG: RNA recognition motif domain-containing protein [Acidobacteriota bacterium]
MKNIFVGNLDFAATEDEVRALFESFGAVERAAIIKDRDTGRSRGFGFVEMTVDSEADSAIGALNGRELNGRALKVNEALPKGEGGGRGGSRGGGGFERRRREPRW